MVLSLDSRQHHSMLLEGEGGDTGEREARHKLHHGAMPRKYQLWFWWLVQVFC